MTHQSLIRMAAALTVFGAVRSPIAWFRVELEATVLRDRMDIAADARGILAGLLAHPWGQMSPSVYAPARLLSLSPHLLGHAQRVRVPADHPTPCRPLGRAGGVRAGADAQRDRGSAVACGQSG